MLEYSSIRVIPQSSLLPLLQTSRQWNSIARHTLYRRPVLKYDEQCVLFIRAITADHPAAKIIQNLTIDSPHLTLSIDGAKQEIQATHVASYLAKILPLASRITSLSLNGPQENPEETCPCQGQPQCPQEPDTQFLELSAEKMISDYIYVACSHHLGPMGDLENCK